MLSLGVGFVEIGIITKEKKDILGITTTSVVLVITAVAMSVCYGYYILAVLMTLLTYLALLIKRK